MNIQNTSSFYKFNFEELSVVAGGQSVLDQPRLNIHNMNEADSFLKSYGYDISVEKDRVNLWYFHRRALVLLTSKLKFAENEIPEVVRVPEKLEDLRNLLIWASSPKDDSLQRWSCAMLRCIHVFIHSESDLFSSFSEEIQKQVLSSFEQCVVQQEKLYLRSFKKEGHARVELCSFQTKPFKTSSSSVIKLLAKPDAVAMKIFDKVGVRFVTNTIFDSFQVIRFLVEENLMSYAHIMPDQSSNNLYPVNEFIRVCEKMNEKHGTEQTHSPEKIDRLLKAHLKSQTKTGFLKLFRKSNPFSANDFQYIKFISRKLIRVETSPGKEFSFFYPFEVQIMNLETYSKMQGGDSEHDSYKNRQIEAARKRVLKI